MWTGPRGFTLIETLAASAVLLFGVAAVAGLISVSVETRARAEWQSRAQGLADARLQALRLEAREEAVEGGSLDAKSAVPGFHDYLRLEPDGAFVGAGAADGTFLRLWRIEAGEPIRLDVVVYWRRGPESELVPLARAGTALAGVR